MRAGNVVLYVLVGVIGVFNLFYPSISSGFNNLQPNLGDAYFNAFVLEHGYKSFFDTSYDASFYSPAFFYPTKLVTTYSDNLLGAAPLYWIFRTMFDWVTSFELWEISVSVLTYVAMIIWLRHIKVHPSVAAVTSFVYVFGISRVIQLSHPQLLPQFFTPLAFIFLYRFLRRPAIKDMNAFIFLVFMQAAAGYYLGWFLILSLGFLILALPVFMQDDFRKVLKFVAERKKKVAVHLFIWVLIFGVFWAPYIFTSFRYRDLWDWSNIRDNLASPYSYFLVPITNIWYPLLKHLPILIKPTLEQYLFNGLFLFSSVVGGIVYLFRIKDNREFSGLIKSFTIVGLLLLLISLRINGYSLWYFFYHTVPGADGIRYVSRIWVIAYFYLYTAFAIMLSHFVRKYQGSILFKIFYFSLIVFFIAEQLVFFKSSVSKDTALTYVDKVGNIVETYECGVFYLETSPEQELYIAEHIHAMWAGMDLNTPTLNGYTGISKYKLGENLERHEINEMLQGVNIAPVCILTSENREIFLKDIY
ncbi:hypothetical protein C4561_03710 [candidate division WWE3 bacterium]|jgi:hypothetical protein|uniref:Glycosyltransferase RgtA/B/C/D-like domain-containing protein n=1 Tax=candidate division WWE3 bacterium TaxID=2053526 RepID=A0A3A4ZC63_UNCKA|nr:MAG: hypothetical protein C4561_03710 [candidate division WWE3 bacterium]